MKCNVNINQAAAEAADREDVSVLVPELVHLVHLLLAFLKPPEVVLDEERGVELADGDLVVPGWRHDLVQQLLTRPLPYLLNHGSQFFVCLVNVTCPRIISIISIIIVIKCTFA